MASVYWVPALFQTLSSRFMGSVLSGQFDKWGNGSLVKTNLLEVIQPSSGGDGAQTQVYLIWKPVIFPWCKLYIQNVIHYQGRQILGSNPDWIRIFIVTTHGLLCTLNFGEHFATWPFNSVSKHLHVDYFSIAFHRDMGVGWQFPIIFEWQCDCASNHV